MPYLGTHWFGQLKVRQFSANDKTAPTWDLTVLSFLTLLMFKPGRFNHCHYVCLELSGHEAAIFNRYFYKDGLNFGYFHRWAQLAFGRWTTTITEMTTHLADAISELNIAVRVPVRVIIFSVFSTIVDLYSEVMILTVDYRKLSLIVAFFWDVWFDPHKLVCIVWVIFNMRFQLMSDLGATFMG